MDMETIIETLDEISSSKCLKGRVTFMAKTLKELAENGAYDGDFYMTSLDYIIGYIQSNHHKKTTMGG